MGYTATYHPDVKTKDLPKIDTHMHQRIKKAIESRLLTAPHDYGLPLRKTLKGYWKLRVGDYRVVYGLAGKNIIIYCICHRKDVYRIAAERNQS